MSLDARTAQEQLTPEERRTLLRAFADRMLLKVFAMDDPEDMPGVERATRVAAVIERIYSRCDRAEKHAPDPNKLEAERARAADEAIKARVQLANTFDWGEERRKALGAKWDAAQNHLKAQDPEKQPAPVRGPAAAPAAKTAQPAPQVIPAVPVQPRAAQAVTPSAKLPGLPSPVDTVDFTDAIHQLRAELGLADLSGQKGQPAPP